MDITDVDPNADRAQERVTSYIFEFHWSLEWHARPSSLAVYLPSNMLIWPSAVLFNTIYAIAVVHHFGVGFKGMGKQDQQV